MAQQEVLKVRLGMDGDGPEIVFNNVKFPKIYKTRTNSTLNPRVPLTQLKQLLVFGHFVAFLPPYSPTPKLDFLRNKS